VRKTWIGAAVVVAALGGFACQGGGVNSDPTEPDATPTSEEGYVEDPCYKGTDAALAAPATDGCTTEPQPDES